MSTNMNIQQLARDRFDYIDLTDESKMEISSCTTCGVCYQLTETGCSGMDHVVCFECKNPICRPCGEKLMEEATELMEFALTMKFHQLQACPFCRAPWIFYRYHNSLRLQSPPHEKQNDVTNEIVKRKNRRSFGVAVRLQNFNENMELAYSDAYDEAAEMFFETMTDEDFEVFQTSGGVFRWLSFEEFVASQ